MTNEEKLEMLKAMIGDSTDSNIVLSTYLKIAGEKIINKAYPYTNDITEVTRSYENADIPATMLRSVTPHVGIIK